jgi:Raf kinase inhibitor-like YbhB/YbcL family protein
MDYRLLLACLLTLSCSQESSAGPGRDSSLTIMQPETRATANISISSPAFAANGAIPLRHSAYGLGIAPALTWSSLPPGTRSVALAMEDPDAMSARPFVHWLAWNFDPAAGGLAEGRPPSGVAEGKNGRGSTGYFGPRPHGSKPHHYHFQLFALDAPLTLPAGASRPQFLAAMKGHVLAKGDLVGLFAEPAGR